MKRMVALAAMVAALAILSAGCSRSNGSLPTTGPGQQNPWQRTALWVEQDGQARPFENGQAVAVGTVTVELFIAPYPPLREGSIDLYARDRVTGQPVEGDGLQIIFDMYMPHGSIRAKAVPTGGGHYLIPYKLVMPGEWRVDITISASRDVAALAFIFRVD